jgi:hypothetical protein
MSAGITFVEKLYSVYRLPYVQSSTVNFSFNGNGCKNYLRPFNRDVLHRPLCEDSDKIPEGRTSAYILHLSGSTYSILFLPAPYHVLSSGKLEAVLQIRIRDPVLFWPPDLGSRIQPMFSESVVTICGLKIVLNTLILCHLYLFSNCSKKNHNF